MRRLLKRLSRNEAGNFAVVAALAFVPVIGMAGLGVDYSQAYSARTTLQGEADAIAIAVASEGPGVTSRYYDAMTAAASERLASGDASFSGRWISPSDYQIDASAGVPRTLSRLIPVGADTIGVSARSVARYMGARLVYKPPATMFLDPDAWDYNRISAYCFDPEAATNGVSTGRSKSVAIADNNGGRYKDPIPQCGPGEVLSFQLFNVIEGKHRPSNMNRTSNYNNYYTDTTRGQDGVDVHNLKADLLETILCPTLSVCHDGNGGLIPKGAGRTPRKNTKPCKAGQYMYYGWEDRPVGDRDYNDIRIIIECPTYEKVGEENVRLIR